MQFFLGAQEAKARDWLFMAAPKLELKSAPTDVGVIEKGKRLVQLQDASIAMT